MDTKNYLLKSFLCLFIASAFTVVIQHKLYSRYQRRYAIAATKHLVTQELVSLVQEEIKMVDKDFDTHGNQNGYRKGDTHVTEENGNKRAEHMDIITAQHTPVKKNRSEHYHIEHSFVKANSSAALRTQKESKKAGITKKHDLERKVVKPNSLEVDRRFVKTLGCRKLPDVLIIGFEKCGTVTFKSFLGIHPQIFVPNLHQNYNLFNKGTNLNVAQFTRNQKCTPTDKLRLEKLSTWGTALKTFQVIPRVKLIAIVREPVERTMSHFVHRIAICKEKRPYDFDKTVAAIMNGKGPIKQSASILFRQSQYIDRLRPWSLKYGIDNIHIVDGDNFVKNPVLELQKIEHFLELKPYITDEKFVYNPARKFYCLKDKAGSASCMSKNKGRAHPSMSEVTRTRLQHYYRPYNEDLFKLLGHRFSWNY